MTAEMNFIYDGQTGKVSCVDDHGNSWLEKNLGCFTVKAFSSKGEKMEQKQNETSFDLSNKYVTVIENITLHSLKPKRIIFNNKSTICYFPNGDKVVVTCHDGEQYEKEVGVMACIMKKLYGTRAEFLRTVQKGYVQPQPQKQKEVDKSKWIEKYDPIKDD
jgi:hypothetical protein